MKKTCHHFFPFIMCFIFLIINFSFINYLLPACLFECLCEHASVCASFWRVCVFVWLCDSTGVRPSVFSFFLCVCVFCASVCVCLFRVWCFVFVCVAACVPFRVCVCARACLLVWLGWVGLGWVGLVGWVGGSGWWVRL